MKKIIFLFALLPALFFSCKNKDKKATETETTTPATDYEVNISGNFYQRYEGTIGGKSIIMNVVKYNSNYNINYYYTDYGKIISLIYQPDSVKRADSLVFIEPGNYIFSDNRPVSDAQLCLQLKPDGISGIWTGGDRKTQLPVVLHMQQNEKAYSFIPVAFTDSVKIVGYKKDTPTARSHLQVLEPEKKDLQGNWYINAVKELVFGDKKPGNISLVAYLKQNGEDFLKGYRDDIDSFKTDFSSEADIPFSFLNYEQLLNTNLLYNDNDYTVLEANNYIYTGGAHGMSGESLLCFDMLNKKCMKLADVTTIDSVQLQKLVQKNFRIQYDIPDSKPLTSVLFENKLTLTNNFYFTAKGIGFVYQPYEVAAYAFGIIRVWVPFEELKSSLQPEFSRRMGL